MKIPQFTIVIPVFKVEEYLCKCLDSVVNQTCSDWECICVDDGSPDRCGRILDDYEAACRVKGLRFHVIHQQNAGVSVARNVALDMATGEWVQFLDGDDSLTLDFLEKVSAELARLPEVDAIEHTAIYCLKDGRRVYGNRGITPPECIVTGEDVLSDPYGIQFTALARCACYKVFRRAVIQAHGLRFQRGLPLSEDALFAVQFYVFAYKIALRPRLAGYQRIYRPGSALLTVSSDKLIKKLSSIEALDELWARHPSRGLSKTICAWVLGFVFLGRGGGDVIRRECVDAVVASRLFLSKGVRFLLRQGTVKSRLFALAYILLPSFGRRRLLLLLGGRH